MSPSPSRRRTRLGTGGVSPDSTPPRSPPAGGAAPGPAGPAPGSPARPRGGRGAAAAHDDRGSGPVVGGGPGGGVPGRDSVDLAAAAALARGDLAQQGPELGRGGAAGRVLDQQAGQHRGQGAEALGAAGLAVDDRGQGLELASAEGRLALDREPQGGAERPQVGGRAHRFGLDLLGRHVGGRAHHQAGRGQPGVALDRGDAEVGQLGGAVLADHHVLGLEVAVDDPGPVGRLQRVQQPEPEPGGPFRGQRPLAADQLLQGRRRDQLHDDEVLPAVMGDVVDGDHTGVAEPGGRPRLPRHPGPEPLPLGGVAPTGQVDLLERDLPRQQRVGRPPDHAHAAVPELLLELVAVGDPPPGTVGCHRPERYRLPGRVATTLQGWSRPAADDQQTPTGGAGRVSRAAGRPARTGGPGPGRRPTGRPGR